MKPMMLLGSLAALLAAGFASATDYVVESSVWIDGELRGTPTVVVESDKEATIEMAQGDTGWRMTLLVEAPMDHEGAAPDAIWIRVGISERIDGDWEFLTDSMLGVRTGATGSFSVVDPGIDAATPETSRLFVELNARPAED